MTINFYSKNVYGTMLYYLANRTEANKWYALTGKKTITGDDMTNLHILTGVDFERVFEAQV